MAQITPIIGGLLIPINALSLNHGSGPLLAPSQSEGPGYPSQLISGLPTVFLTPHTGINPSAFAIQNVAQVSPNIILSTSQGISSVEGSSFPVPSNMIITQQKQQSNHPTINLLPEIIKNGEPGGNLNPSMPKNIDNSSKPAGTLMEECQQQNNEELKLTNSPLNSDKMVKQNTAVSTQNLLPMSSISEPCDLPVSNPLCNQGLIQQNVIPISSNIGHGAFPVHSSMVNQGIIQQSLLLRDQLYNNYGRYILPKNPLEYVQCNFMLNNDTSSNNSGGKIQDMNVSSVNAVSQKSNTTGVQGSISNIAESDRCNASQANIKKRISHKNKDIVKVKLDFGLPSSEKKELFLNKHNQQPKSTNSKQNSDSMLNQNVSINIQNTSSMSYVFGKDDLLGSSTSVKKYLIHQTILQDSILNKKKTMLKVRKDLIDLTRNSSDNNSKYPNSVCERTRKVTRQRVRKQITEEKERRNSEVSSRRPTLVFSTLKRKDSSQEQHINHGIQHENLKKAKIDSVISYDIIATRDSDKECKPILTNTSNEIITIDSDSDYDEENVERYIQPEKNSDNTSSVLPSDKTMELIDDMNPSPKSITYNVHQNFKQLIDIMHKDYIDQPLDCLKQETCNMDVDKSQTLMKNNTNVNHTNAPFIKELVKKIKVEPVDEYEPAIKDHIQDIVQKVKVEPVDTYGNEEAVYDIVEKIKIEPVENDASLYTHSGDADSEEDGEYITCDLVDPNKKSITKETIQTPIKTETTECSPINGHMTSVQSTKCSLENVLKSHVYDNENSQGTNKNLTQCSDVDGNENVDHFSESELVIDEHNEEPNIIKSLVQVQKNELNPNQNQGKEKQRRRGRVKYTCITCSEIFHSQADYSRHILNHTGGKLFECDECKKKFNLKYKLASHRDKTHLNATYVCQYCKKEFKYRSCLMKHSAIHTGILPYYCDGCGDSFKTNDDLIAHRLEESEFPHYCTVCGEKFAWKSLLKVHQRVHGLKTPYKCKICAKRFKYSVLKLYHMIEASHGLPYDYYHCNNLKIITKSIVRSVMTEDKNKLVVKTESNKLSPESSEKVLPNVKVTKPVTRTEPIESKICTFCNSKFSTSAMLKLHIQNEHSIYLAYYTQINFQCDENKQIEKTEITHQGRNNEVGRIEILPTVEASKVAPASFDEEMLQSLMGAYRTILPKPQTFTQK